MASVHESLYFNPMMTNGVVHANVFGIKDWVTPYKISVLALLYDMTTSKITLPERRRLNKLILPLQQVCVCVCLSTWLSSWCSRCLTAVCSVVMWVHQGPDLTLGQFLKTVEECCPQTAYAVKLRYAGLINACNLVAVREIKTTGAFLSSGNSDTYL